MGLGIITGMLCFVTCIYAIQHEKPRENDTPSDLLPKNIEEWVSSRLGAVEQRLNWKFHDINAKVRRMNHSLEISQLEKLFHMVNEELQISEEKQLEKDKLVNNLESTLSEQNKEIHHLKKRLGHLESGLIEVRKYLTSSVDGNTPPINNIKPGSSTPGKINGPTKNPDLESPFPRDCKEAYRRKGLTGLEHTYVDIKPRTSSEQFKVRCEIEREEGWTVIQRRFDGSVNFFRGWDDYKEGFGDIAGEFWLGLQKIHELTNQGDYKLRIEMKTWEGKDYWAEYDHFKIADEDDHYRLHVHGYHGDAGDSLTSRWENHNGQPFSTKDKDNDGRFIDNCAALYKGAWWFTTCFESHLNGVYKHKGSHNNYFLRNGLQWNTIHIHSSLQSVAMMIIPTENVVEPKNRGINGIA